MRKVKVFVEEIALASFLTVIYIANRNVQTTVEKTSQATIIDTDVQYKTLTHSEYLIEQEEIRNEIFYGELEEVALVVQAESGNQDELGKRYVADCILNRVDDKDFPDNIHDVIYQINPIQFSTTVDGAIEKAGYTVTEEIFQLVLEEYENRTNFNIIYFRTDRYSDSGTPAFKHGDHYFSTK